MRRAPLVLLLLAAGCTVETPLTDDAGSARDAGACRVVPDLAIPLDDPLCPPSEPPPPTLRPAAQGAWAESEALGRAWCIEARARCELQASPPAECAEASWWDARAGLFGFGELRPLPSETYDRCEADERALAWLERHRALFMIDDEVELVLTRPVHGDASFTERWRGLPVRYAFVTLAPSPERPGQWLSLDALVLPTHRMPATDVPEVSRDRAIALAAPPAPAQASLAVIPPLDGAETARLIWIVTWPGQTGWVEVDALTGEVETVVKHNPT